MRPFLTFVSIVFFFAVSDGQVIGRPGPARDICSVLAQPHEFLGKAFKLTAQAEIQAGGTLLGSGQCPGTMISMIYAAGYENHSEPTALKTFKFLEYDVYESQLKSSLDFVAFANVVLRGTFENNPRYKLSFPRGDKTLTAWDSAYPYEFVVTQIVSLRQKALRR